MNEDRYSATGTFVSWKRGEMIIQSIFCHDEEGAKDLAFAMNQARANRLKEERSPGGNDETVEG